MKLKAIWLAGVIALPMHQPGNWQVLQYNDISPNQVEFGTPGMSVDVNASAGPVIYPLPEPLTVRRIEVSGALDRLLDLDTRRQGDGRNDDYSLKVGLVVAGDKTLNGIQKMFSADWVVSLFELAPEGAGIDNIHFLTAVQSSEQLHRQREHPLSELIIEDYVWLLDKPGDFNLAHTLDQPLEVIAVWLSMDGDDSNSRFITRIDSLKLVE